MTSHIRRVVLFVSLACFIVCATWFIAATCTARQLTYNFRLRPQTLALSGGQQITGFSGYSLCTSRAGIELFYTDLAPVITREVGTDAKPLAGNFDPSVESLFRLRLFAIAVVSGIAGLLCVGLLVFGKRRSSPSFPIRLLRLLRVHACTSLGTPAAG